MIRQNIHHATRARLGLFSFTILLCLTLKLCLLRLTVSEEKHEILICVLELIYSLFDDH